MNFIKKNPYVLLIPFSFITLFIGFYYINHFPDLDTDAYAHYSIARQLYIEGKINPIIHWVWLPLYHYIQIPFIAAGFGITALRFLSLILGLLIPYIIYFYYYKDEFAIKKISFRVSLICITSPIYILMETAAQPEIIFFLLLVLFFIFFDKEKYLLSSIVLGLGVMLRYELWVVPILFIVFYLFRKFLSHFHKFEFIKKRKFILNIIIPLSLMIIWTVIRRITDGVWFYFITETKGFATGVIDATSSGNKLQSMFTDIYYYPAYIPYMLFGPVLFLSLFGLKNIYKNKSIIFISINVLILLFISFSWMTKSSLGLYRHFTILIPFYSFLIGFGVYAVSDYISHRLHTVLKKTEFETIRRRTSFILILSVVLSQVFMLYVWSSAWLDYSKQTFGERIKTAEFIKTLPQESIIYTDEASVEILSNIEMSRFKRFWLTTDLALDNIQKDFYDNKTFYIVSWSDRIEKYKQFGNIIYTSTVDKVYNKPLQVLKAGK